MADPDLDELERLLAAVEPGNMSVAPATPPDMLNEARLMVAAFNSLPSLIAAARRLAELEARRCDNCADWHEAWSEDHKTHWVHSDRCDRRHDRAAPGWHCADWRAR